MASLDATIVNVALPHIARDLHTDVSGLQWVLTGYLLSLASLILLGGALGDRFGRRRVFIVGTVWFAAASVLCALAPNIGVLVAARLLQGIGGALLTPGSLAIIQVSFRERDRAAAVGAWSGLIGVAGAVGPFVGGALVDGPGWRFAFLLNVPLAAVTVALAVVAVPESHEAHRAPHLDLAGAAYAVVGLAAVTWGITERNVVGVVVGVAVALVFVRHVRRVPDPLVPPGLFAVRVFSVINVMTVQLYAAIGVAFFLVAYQLQVAAKWSALAAGTAMLPSTVLMIVLSARSGALGQRIGPRPQLIAGPVLGGVGLVLLARIGVHPSWLGDVLPGSVLFGVGLVTFVAPLTATVMAAADPAHVSVASGVNNAVARTASLGAIAVVPVISGLASASGSAEVTHAFRLGLIMIAALAASAAITARLGLKRTTACQFSARRVHCHLDGPPLQVRIGA